MRTYDQSYQVICPEIDGFSDDTALSDVLARVDVVPTDVDTVSNISKLKDSEVILSQNQELIDHISSEIMDSSSQSLEDERRFNSGLYIGPTGATGDPPRALLVSYEEAENGVITDISGANLTFSMLGQGSMKFGDVVFFWARFLFPETTSTLDTKLAGLSFSSGQDPLWLPFCAYADEPGALMFGLKEDADEFSFKRRPDGDDGSGDAVPVTNNQLSGKVISIHGQYHSNNV